MPDSHQWADGLAGLVSIPSSLLQMLVRPVAPVLDYRTAVTGLTAADLQVGCALLICRAWPPSVASCGPATAAACPAGMLLRPAPCMVMALDVCAGIHHADLPPSLQGVAFRHADAQHAVVQLMAQPNAVLVGHSLHHDLQALKIGVTPASLLCIDTSFLWGYRSVPWQPHTRSPLECNSLQQERLISFRLWHAYCVVPQEAGVSGGPLLCRSLQYCAPSLSPLVMDCLQKTLHAHPGALPAFCSTP